jgi:2-polyprenyl-3-methyl-5-hydroxy-6-metoxy-1,4-benzoquinol methylase
MFKFNFIESCGDTEQNAHDPEKYFKQCEMMDIRKLPSICDIYYDNIEVLNTLKNNEKHVMKKRSLQDIKYEIAKRDTFSPLNKALEMQSDLIPNEYEGGFKIWECSLDLISYLNEKINNQELDMFCGGNVLEIGCGGGLPGIFCMNTDNFSTVDFQDFNSEVLELVTIPNILLNSLDKEFHSGEAEIDFQEVCNLNSSFFYGDWSGLNKECVGGKQYQLILASEVLYNVSAYQKLCDLFHELLAPEGIVLVASKSYYFGCGGGVDGFLSFVETIRNENDNSRYLRATKVMHFGSNNGLSRDIIQIKWEAYNDN